MVMIDTLLTGFKKFNIIHYKQAKIGSKLVGKLGKFNKVSHSVKNYPEPV
jgi:hypothetical protein